jgi:Holliday junction resolvase
MVNHYQRGRRVEQEVIDHLGTLGYDCIRSAGSKGAVDIVAVHDEEVAFIQVKITESVTLSPAERERLMRVSLRARTVPLVAYKASVPGDGRRKEIRFRRMTGTGPRDHEPWSPQIQN